MNLNADYTLAYNSTVGMIAKLVQQYIDSGALSERFNAFDKPAIEYGNGFELDTMLAASAQSTKAAEHGAFPPKVQSLVFSTVTGKQYAVTLDEKRVRECVGDAQAQSAYAAELTESLYQGWYNDKNAAVAGELAKLIGKNNLSGATVTLGTDVAKFAEDMITAIKTWVENIREGVAGTDYGNAFVGSGRIAARDVVIVMSNSLAAMLDVYGYSKAFTPAYLETANVMRITSNRIAENTVLVTDTRNVQVRRKYEKFVGPIQNSDGSENFFYNKEEFIAAAIVSGGTYDGQVAYPFKVITTTEEQK